MKPLPVLATLLLPAGLAWAAPGTGELARIVFPDWSDTAAGRIQLVTLPPSQNGWGSGRPMRLEVLPKLAIQTGEESMTLVAGMRPTGDEGLSASHAAGMGLSAYHFRLHDGHWVLAAQQEGFDYKGYFAQAQVRAMPLAAGAQAIAVESGSCWQGYCGQGMAVYRVAPGKVEPKPVASLALTGYNYNSAGDCRRRLGSAVALEPGENLPDDSAPESHSCYKIEGSLSVAPSETGVPGDLVIHYVGAISPAAKAPGPARRIDQELVLRFIDGEYRVASGSNPIPAI